MLKVTVKNEKVLDDRWEDGMIRMSADGKIVIMISFDFEDDAKRAVVLRDNNAIRPYISINDKSHWVQVCPVVVENAELIIGGN